MINYEWFRAKWVAVKTDDPQSILQPIGLSDFSLVDWEAGINASVHQRDEKLFVSPPMNGWVLFFGDVAVVLERYFALYKMQMKQIDQDAEPNDPNWFFAISQMSTVFPEVHIYVSYESIYQYARAIQGEVQRAYFMNLDQGDYGEIGAPTDLEIYHGASFTKELYEKHQEPLTSELPFVMAGIWSVNPLEFDEPQWEWLRKSQGQLYNGVSDTLRESREWLDNWRKRFQEAYLQEKNANELN
jgi:hypothetical protein